MVDSQLGTMRLVGYLPSHIQCTLVKYLLTITFSEICIILQIIRKPHPMIIYGIIKENIIKIILHLKTSKNKFTSIDVKFPSSFAFFSASSGYNGMFSLADFLQIAFIICHVVFLLFLLCF